LSPLTRTRQDGLLKIFLNINGLISTLAVVFIFFFLAKESLLALRGESTAFFLDESWYPSEGKFNMIPMLLGSLFVTFGSVLLALPLGFFSATLATFYSGPRFSWFFKRAIELYTGIPSVIFGFWGLMKIVPLLNEIHPPGQSLLAGIIILTLMIFPILTLSFISSFEMACRKNFRVSESLGIRKSIYIIKILLPSIKGQVLGGVLLSIGRAVGETMAVLMVCGNIVKIPGSLFDPIRTLTANIALEMAYAMGNHRSSLFLTGLILLLMVSLLFLLSELIKGVKPWKA
jgi:phosphate transport system permease protein